MAGSVEHNLSREMFDVTSGGDRCLIIATRGLRWDRIMGKKCKNGVKHWSSLVILHHYGQLGTVFEQNENNKE